MANHPQQIRLREVLAKYWLQIGLAFIMLSYVVDLLFTIIEFEPVRANYFCWTGHCFIDVPIYRATLYYHYFGYVSLMCKLFAAKMFLNGVMYEGFKVPIFAMLSRLMAWVIWLEIFDMVDYAISYSTPYNNLLGIGNSIDVEYNLVKAVAAIIMVAKTLFDGISSRMG